MASLVRFVAPSYEKVGEISLMAMESPAVQAFAEKIADEARRIAVEEGYPDLADAVTVTSARPKGRGQVAIVIDDDAATGVEFGDTDTERARILGRAAGVPLWPDIED